MLYRLLRLHKLIISLSTKLWWRLIWSIEVIVAILEVSTLPCIVWIRPLIVIHVRKWVLVLVVIPTTSLWLKIEMLLCLLLLLEVERVTHIIILHGIVSSLRTEVSRVRLIVHVSLAKHMLLLHLLLSQHVTVAAPWIVKQRHRRFIMANRRAIECSLILLVTLEIWKLLARYVLVCMHSSHTWVSWAHLVASLLVVIPILGWLSRHVELIISFYFLIMMILIKAELILDLILHPILILITLLKLVGIF